MQHIVTVWGARFSSEDELAAFVETLYDEDGEAQPSVFLDNIGCSWLDDDFLELHFLSDAEERAAFVSYLRSEYAPHDAFADQLPATIGEALEGYNSIILVSGSNSSYGAINEELFQIAKTGAQPGSPAVLLAAVEYESR
ncbi:immunity 22 family protein [Paenibacillus sp. NPDC057967]|uniref:immunity 22 family protein n=1 Tax=Paenibacillus sp. NPDC057967 TaxID=3346293 RepID=UPI0036DC4562